MAQSKREFRKVEAGGEIFKFENVGDAIEGTYVGKRSITRNDKQRTQATIYDIRDDDGKAWSFWGTAFLNARMDKVDPADEPYIRITFVSEEDTGQQSPMKVFDVEVAA